MAFQQEPVPRLWLINRDGSLRTSIFLENGNVYGPSRIILSGQADPIKGDPIILSMAVVPSPNSDRDEIWLAVVRARESIGSPDVVTIEYFTLDFESDRELRAATYLDMSVTVDIKGGVVHGLFTQP